MMYYKKCRERIRYLLTFAWYKEMSLGKKFEDFGANLKKINQVEPAPHYVPNINTLGLTHELAGEEGPETPKT
jgi:hypothetical protein